MRNILVFLTAFFITHFSTAQKIAGPLTIETGIEDGYTLFAPLSSKTTYLIDNCGRIINKWQSEYLPGNTAYLMPNGNLLRTIKLPNTVIAGGGGGGGVELFDWDGNRIWLFELNNDTLRLHHDVSYLPNGNVLMIVWEVRSADKVLAVGGDPARIPYSGVIWSEQIIEVKPIPPNNSEIVWRWSLWDHLVQDFDNTKNGYGIVADHPELVNINYISQVTPDWIHANSIDYNPDLDQIIISSPFFNELWIIDHSTSSVEASSHAGGDFGKGGDLLYRWGNPVTYGRGTESDQQLFFQHDVHWVTESQHKGKIIVFNNRKGPNFSSVDIIDPPLVNNVYQIEAGPFGPTVPDLDYMDDPKELFFSENMAGAQVLPNGNLFICSTRQGIIFEVTPLNKKVWLYKSPITSGGIVGRDFQTTDPNFANDLNFRANKYPTDYPGFIGRDLSPMEPIEGEPWASCALVTSTDEFVMGEFQVFPNPVENRLFVRSSNAEQVLHVELLNLHGQPLSSKEARGETYMDISNFPGGIYILKINGRNRKIVKSNSAN